jgi:succinyl-CoA synthetase beta subunit
MDKLPLKNRLQEFLESRGERKVLLEHEIKDFLSQSGINVPKGIFVDSTGCLPPARSIPFPAVAKVVSSGIVSRSDVGGVRLGICNLGELKKEVDDLLRLKGAEGVIVEEMVPSGIEVIVGGIIDVEFGPIVMFGLGGLFVELFRDVSFALAPVTVDQAKWLVNDTKGGRILRGFRGMPPVDLDSLLKIIVAVSELIGTGLLQEIDMNPVALYPTGAVVLDAKMKAM